MPCERCPAARGAGVTCRTPPTCIFRNGPAGRSALLPLGVSSPDTQPSVARPTSRGQGLRFPDLHPFAGLQVLKCALENPPKQSAMLKAPACGLRRKGWLLSPNRRVDRRWPPGTRKFQLLLMLVEVLPATEAVWLEVVRGLECPLEHRGSEGSRCRHARSRRRGAGCCAVKV